MNRTEKRQQRTRKALIQAFRKITAEKGVDAVTIRDIAEAADIALGSFYSYFDSKEAILDEAVRDIVFEAGELIDAMNADAEDPVEVMASAFMNFHRIIMSDHLLGGFIVRVSAHNPDFADSLTHRFLRDLESGTRAGKFNVPHVRAALAIVNASFMQFFRGRLQGDLGEDSVVPFVHMMVRMLGAGDDEARRAAEKAWKRFSDIQKER